MHRPNFCVECGERLTSRSWRARLGRRFCDVCARRLRSVPRTLIVIALIGFSAFALGRWLRPAPPPLLIQRLATSPLSDLPVDPNAPRAGDNREPAPHSPVDEVVYLCGARTQKGTPCRRRVHSAGDRCYQHKGMPAMVPLDKLKVKNK